MSCSSTPSSATGCAPRSRRPSPDSGVCKARHTAAKDRTSKTVRPNQGTTTEAWEPRIGVRRPIGLGTRNPAVPTPLAWGE